MSRDIISDALNNMMNAKRARKRTVQVSRYSKVLLGILRIAKEKGYVEDFSTNEKEKTLMIKLARINECKAIKPRFFASMSDFDKYIRRFLPARDFGIIIVSTNKGLMTHEEAIEKTTGGSLLAYFY